jgi:hypothetical protein
LASPKHLASPEYLASPGLLAGVKPLASADGADSEELTRTDEGG